MPASERCGVAWGGGELERAQPGRAWGVGAAWYHRGHRRTPPRAGARFEARGVWCFAIHVEVVMSMELWFGLGWVGDGGGDRRRAVEGGVGEGGRGWARVGLGWSWRVGRP